MRQLGQPDVMHAEDTPAVCDRLHVHICLPVGLPFKASNTRSVAARLALRCQPLVVFPISTKHDKCKPPEVATTLGACRCLALQDFPGYLRSLLSFYCVRW
jgi:hypothetical protein